MDIKTVYKSERLSGAQFRPNLFLVDSGCRLIRQSENQDIGLPGGGSSIDWLETALDRRGVPWTARTLRHDNLTAGIAQVEGVSVPLGTVAQDGQGSAIE